MDLRNVIFAIALSFAVLFGWSVIFETPKIEEEKNLQRTENESINNDKTSSVPSVNVENLKPTSISREDAIKSTNRIKFENENIEGSISLEGALIAVSYTHLTLPTIYSV